MEFGLKSVCWSFTLQYIDNFQALFPELHQHSVVLAWMELSIWKFWSCDNRWLYNLLSCNCSIQWWRLSAAVESPLDQIRWWISWWILSTISCFSQFTDCVLLAGVKMGFNNYRWMYNTTSPVPQVLPEAIEPTATPQLLVMISLSRTSCACWTCIQTKYMALSRAACLKEKFKKLKKEVKSFCDQ